MQPLYDCLKSGGPQGASPLVLPYLQDCHHQLKMAISRAPALGLPDYTQPFNLFVSESEGHATGVLAQQHAGRQRTIGYYSCRLDPVARTSPTCLKAVHAAHALLDKTADIVLGHDLIIQASHDLAAVLSQTQPRHLAHQRHLRLQCSLLLPSHITFKRCSVINPATLLPHSRGEEGDSEVAPEVEDPHDCLQVLLDDTSTPPGVTTQELPHPDLELWTDGSRFADQSGRYHTGYAVTTETQVVKAEAIPASMSAQEAELIALKEACTLAKGKTVNIRTDSRYAHGIAHDFGIIWKNRGFITAAGTPVKHADLIKSLMEALQLPTKVAVIKVKAHGKVNSKAARGNYLADCTAKEAAMGNVSSEWLERIPKEKQEMTYPCMVATRAQKKKEEEKKIISPTLAQLQEEQKMAPEEEHKAWKTWGAAYENGLWTMQGLVCLPRKLYPAIAAWAHEVTHRGKNQALGYAKKMYFAPGLSTAVNAYIKACSICATCNPAPTTKVPYQHLAKSDYPFQRIQVDHIQLPKSGRYEYALVAVDMFSGWPEAYPVVNMTAKLTAKKLITEIACRFGVPQVIESDQGPAFTGQIYTELWQMLGANIGLHTPYHPQSSGKVERMNGTLKNKLLKMTQENPKEWPELLPIALYHVRHTPQAKHGLTPYEILFGSPPKLSEVREQQLAEGMDKVVKFVVRLSKELSNTHSAVSASIPESTGDTVHDFQPGDKVYVKKHIRKNCLDPRFDGPYTVILVTPTAVKLEGKTTWTHASHCRRDPASP
ncbi:protein NYNRIN-like [Engystomops pustulosus]|uniref:protein NYNRIN-like n=1 Tax=Engystomops pustulosus TaxID=76066 RepID=UPI003AFA0E7B